MRNQVKTARPAARKGSAKPEKKTAAVPSRKSQPIIQMVERKSSPNIIELPKKSGELPIPVAAFVI